MKLYWLTLVALGLAHNSLVMADDTEIFRPDNIKRIPPNVVFVIDTSGSMSWRDASNQRPKAGEKTRLQIVKDSAIAAINKISEDKPINIAIMRFHDAKNKGSQGGYVVEPLASTGESDEKSRIISAINGLTAGNGTPLVETTFEAINYLTGRDIVWGKQQSGTGYNQVYTVQTNPFIYGYNWLSNKKYGSPSSITSGNKYIHPMTATCQKQHVVVFTDGNPSNDEDSNSTIKDLFNAASGSNKNAAGLSSKCDSEGNKYCGEELAYWAYNTDFFDDASITGKKGDANTIKQNIKIHTVGGFAVGQAGKDLLTNMAIQGGTKKSLSASNEAELVTALQSIFDSISNEGSSFAAPVVSVNNVSSLEHRSDVYYTLFEPSANSPAWAGNIKRYRLSPSGEIYDSKNSLAVDKKTGFFSETAHSYWSTAADGQQVTSGGLSNRLTSDRPVYTSLTATGESKTSFINSGNRVTETNTNITEALLGVDEASRRTKALKWARGIDVIDGKDQKRTILADSLHGTPFVLEYQSDSGTQDVLYSTNNAGYLHAFDPSVNNPKEFWSFIPKELLPNLPVFAEQRWGNGIDSNRKIYGFDGPMSVYHDDEDRDGRIDSGETAYLAVAMRRGGHAYYIFDVSNYQQPRLAKVISNTGDFSELGQTWSPMRLAYVDWNSKKVPVFIFGGGYDPLEDDSGSRGSRIESSVGNAIYMITANDEATGTAFELLWKATKAAGAKGLSLADMTSSIVSEITPVDMDGDGSSDLLYATDVGGRLWRIDFTKGNSASEYAKGGVLFDANLTEEDTLDANYERFFAKPDVVYTNYGYVESVDPNDNTNVQYLKRPRYQITMGSGYRPGPLSTATTDRIFVINDYDHSNPPKDFKYANHKLPKLADYHTYASASAEQRENGYYYTLKGTGEKVLSNTLTVSDTIYATTFRPSSGSIEAGCQPDLGQSRLIILKPNLSLTPEDGMKPEEDSIENVGSTIPPEPKLVFPPDKPDGTNEGPKVVVGLNVFDVEGGLNILQRTFWREADPAEVMPKATP
ncbi:hypothetical protein CHH28_09610 [Bacterioplanes sanyensis]|uniref:VWFA domain-containing protein n=1 Tax=Bacterioplanes sanyensis TaxID=1249553 RepID=A0A222FJV3_9GAMM|nr:PilC/PilY family type IV pilus protein [Bacterioplanes sanyensis]ASP38922.1 hypothetical protein CHH28_09610 [Bacterioplanes sanyensis]